MSMQKGWRPSLLLNKKGQVLGLATGSDATSEHEGGSAPLMTALCGAAPWTSQAVATALKAGVLSSVPNILATRRIVKDLDNILWIEGSVTVRDLEGARTEPTGMIAYSTRPGAAAAMARSSQVSLPNFAEPTNISAAWDSEGFAFRVMGQKQVDKLREFHKALVAGKGMFAGLFLDKYESATLTGVILCDETLLRPEHKASMQEAQAEFEEKVDLALASRADELMRAHEDCCWFGHVSAMNFKDNPDGTRAVRYWLNPSYGVKAQSGCYSFEELLPWIAAGPRSGIALSASL